MKQLFKVCSIILAMVILFCACSSNETKNINVMDESNGKFDDMVSFNDIIKDVKNVDFYLPLDTNGLTEKVEKDDESATAVKRYYDGDILVFAIYEGYGENCFDYYTKSESDKDITVKYIYQDGSVFSVDVSCDDYSISFSELDKKAEYGAKTIYATAGKSADNDFPKYVSYAYENGKAYVSCGCYYDTDGYHYYSAYPIDDKGNIEAEDVLRYQLVEKADVDKSIYTKLNDYRVNDVEICFGEHRLEYTENPDGSKNWFIVANVNAVFNDRAKALEFSDKYGIDVDVSDTDDDYFIAKFDGVTLPVSDKFEDFFEFASQEVNDYYYCSVIFDKDGAVKKLDSSTSALSYY